MKTVCAKFEGPLLLSGAGDGLLERRCFKNCYIPLEITKRLGISAVMNVSVVKTAYIVLLFSRLLSAGHIVILQLCCVVMEIGPIAVM